MSLFGEKKNFLDTPKLETERLILRKITLDDAGDIFHYANDKEVSKYLLWYPHNTINDTKEFINFTMNRYKKDESGDWGIVLKQNYKLIGSCGFVNFNKQHLSAEIGYVLCKDYWNRGLMTEAVKRVIKFGFEDMNLNRIEAMHDIENIASGKVMQNVGMKYEGILRQKIFKKGKFCDCCLYSILKTDYK